MASDIRFGFSGVLLRGFFGRCVVGCFVLSLFVARAEGVIECTYSVVPDHFVCGRTQERWVFTCTGIPEFVSCGFSLTARSGLAVTQFGNVTLTGLTGAPPRSQTFEQLLSMRSFAVMDSGSGGVLSLASELLFGEVDAPCVAAVHTPVAVRNYGVGGPAHAVVQAPCMFVKRVEASGTLNVDGGTLALDMSLPCATGRMDYGYGVGGVTEAAWVGYQAVARVWLCPGPDLCMGDVDPRYCDDVGAAACDVIPPPVCELRETIPFVVDESCSVMVMGAGFETTSCADVCGSSAQLVVGVGAGYTFVEFVVVEETDLTPCGYTGATAGLLDGGPGCACPSPLADPSQPKGYLYGPFYRKGGGVGGVDPEGSDGEYQPEIVAEVNAFDPVGVHTMFVDAMSGSDVGVALSSFATSLLIAGIGDYPSLSFGSIHGVTVGVDFAVLADYEGTLWRILGRVFVTGFIFFRLLISCISMGCWALGVASLRDIPLLIGGGDG